MKLINNLSQGTPTIKTCLSWHIWRLISCRHLIAWLWPLTLFHSLFSVICVHCVSWTMWLANWWRPAQWSRRIKVMRWGWRMVLLVFCVDTGQRSEASFLTGLRLCFGVLVWKAAFPPAGPRSLSTVPGVCFVLDCRSAAVLFQAIPLFSLPSTLSYRRNQTWQLNALWPSSHLENKATAILCGYVRRSSLTHMHTHKDTQMSTVEASVWGEIYIAFPNRGTQPILAA